MNKIWVGFVTGFVKVTGVLPYLILVHPKVKWLEGSSKKIKGPAIVISNHTALFDFVIMLFLFWRNIVHWQIAEVLSNKRVLGPFLKSMGCITVDRYKMDFSFLGESSDVLEDGGIVGIFPEARLPRPEEERPLEFKPSAAFLALKADVPVIPVCTNGKYLKNLGQRCKVVVGAPFYVSELSDSKLSEKENLINISSKIRQRIIDMGRDL